MKTQECDPQRIDRFFAENSATTDPVLASHLDTCETCRTYFNQKAASAADWTEARQMLSPSEFDSASIADYSAGGGTTVLGGANTVSVQDVLDSLAPTDDPHRLGRLGTYEVSGVVGVGGMGVVLKAVDPSLDRVVAIKVMAPQFANNQKARQRFSREARAAAAVLHPNVIPIHAVDDTGKIPYLVMAYIRGDSLQKRLDQQGPLELAEVLRIGSQIAAGLSAAHDQGLVHRDIKPENVLLEGGVERVTITDFGLARAVDDNTVTQAGTIAGTPMYMSPEQARGENVDQSSDLFSLGSLLYALCTGTPPYKADTSYGVMRKIIDEDPLPLRQLHPGTPEWMANVVAKLMAKDKADRFESAAEVHRLLERCLNHIQQPGVVELPDELRNALAVKHLSACQANVYWPERKPRLEYSTKTIIEKTSFPTRNLYAGALTMTSIFLAAIALAATQFGSAFDEPIDDVAGTTAIQKDSSHEPSVFKTLSLKFPNPTQQGKVIVDINRGFIEVEGHEHNHVVIEIMTPPQFEQNAKTGGDNSEFQALFTPRYDLHSDNGQNSIKLDAYNQDYLLNLRIKVPFRTDLKLDSYMDGNLKVQNVTGVIETRSEHSDISLLNITGSAKGYSRNGNLTVRFASVAEDASLDFESYNGTIDLTLPESTAATTAIYSGKSNTLTAFTIRSMERRECPDVILAKVGTKADEYQFGNINGGGIPLRLESEKGQIKIRKPLTAHSGVTNALFQSQ